MNKKLGVYVVEPSENIELYLYIKSKYSVTSVDKCDVIIVSSVKNIKRTLNIVGCGLDTGKEIICIRGGSLNTSFVTELLIAEGAFWI